MANNMDPDQTGSIVNSSVMLGNYLQQTTSVEDIFRCIFLGALRVKGGPDNVHALLMEAMQDFCFFFSHVALETSPVCPVNKVIFRGICLLTLGFVLTFATTMSWSAIPSNILI